MRLSRLRLPAISIAAVLVLVVGSAAQAFACAPPERDDNLHLAASVKVASLSPSISLTLGADRASATPGQAITYTAVVTNTGTTLTISGQIEAANNSSHAAIIAAWYDAISSDPKGRCGDSDDDGHGHDRNHWSPLAGAAGAKAGYTPVVKAPISTGMTFTAVPVAAAGVTYATGPDTITGTNISRGATARWNYTAVIALTPSQAAALFKGAAALPIRESFYAEPTTGNSRDSGESTVVNTEFCRQLTAAKSSGNATNVSVALTLPDGTVRTISKANVAALASIAPGASASVKTAYTVPAPGAKGGSETDTAYLARLAALNGKALAASATAKVGTAGPSAGPAGPVNVTEILPILALAKSGPATVDAGKSATYSLALGNSGSAPARSLALADSLPDGTAIAVIGAPASLAPAATATAHAVYAVPASQPAGNLTDIALLRWTDAGGTAYGPISAQATTRVTRPIVTVTVIVTASSGSLTYGGSIPAITPSYSGWVNGDGPAVLTTAPVCTTTATSASGVGTYKTSCSGAVAPNYTFSYADGTITVTPALVTVTAPSGSMTYGGAVPAIAPSYSGWVNGEGPSVLTSAPTCSTAATSTSGVGTYKTSCTGAAAPDYTLVYVEGSVKVDPALVTVTASSDSMAYGGTVPVITPAYSGFVNGEGPGVLTSAPTCSTAATSASPAGTYHSSCTGAAAANYTFSYVDGTISVDPSVVIVTASSGSLTYGGTVPAITPAYSGWVNGDGPAVLTTAPVCTTSATSASGVGTYKTSCTGAAAPDYTFTYADGTITVTPALVTLTAPSGSMTYGGAVPAIAPSYSGWVNGEGPSVLTSAPTCSTAATSTSGVGTYKTSCTGAAAPDYTLVYVEGSVKVDPALVTVTASSDSMAYGGTVPVITPAYSGFVNGEGPGVLTSAPTCSTAATSTSPAGTYPSSCTGAAAANYTLGYVEGKVSVSSPLLTGHIEISAEPRAAMPVGSSVTVTVKATDPDGAPVPNLAVQLATMGPDAGSSDLTTGPDGTVTYTFVGPKAGTDQLQATSTQGSASIESNTLSVIWFVPYVAASTSTVHGLFFPAPPRTTTFTTSPGTKPSFEQDFPNVMFNGWFVVPGDNSGVWWGTRPFTDIVTDATGHYAGTVVAQGNGEQAFVGDLESFNAVLTGTITVAAAGDVNFTFGVDDTHILGIGGGATDATGRTWTHGVSVFENYPVMGETPDSGSSTVHFPAPGVYPYELDYTECCGAPGYLEMFQGGKALGSTVQLSLTPITSAAATVGSTLTYTVTALGPDGEPLSGQPVELNISGANPKILHGTTDSAGVVNFVYSGAGPGTDGIVATADYGGITAQSNVVSQNWIAQTVPLPTIGSVTPAEGTTVTAPMAITASIGAPAGGTLTSWRVTYQTTAAGSLPVTLASGTGTPPATLATFDPTVLPNGGYTITISAFASGGGGLSSSVNVVVEGNLKLGRYGVTYQDANVPVGGIPIQVLRTYDSFDKSQGDFGIGWQVGVSNFRVSANGALGAGGWSQYDSSCVLGMCQMAWTTARPHFVSVVWPDGHTEIFDFTPTGGSNLFWLGSAAFTARSGSTSSLAVSGDTSLSYSGDGNLYAGIGGPLFAPTRFTLTAKDGTVYLLDSATGLLSETDRVGNTVTVDAAGIHSSLGPSVTFIRDASGRITTLTKPDGSKITYAYNAAGDLASVTDERGNAVTFEYDGAHNLTKTIDPNGHPLRTLTYGTDGRLKTVTDGAGNTSTVSLDPNARTETVTGPDPRLTTVSSMNERGDIVQIDQVFGGKTLTTKFTNDDLGHVLSKTDPAGHVTGATYDAAGSPLTLTEPDGGTWHFTYDSHDALTSITDRTGAQIATLTYDLYGELTKKTTADGDTIYTYGAAGLLASTTNPLGRTTAYGYDSAGHATSVTGPDGRVWHYTYDTAGRTKTVTDPASEATTLTYDPAGSLISYKDALGHGQTYSYDALGRVATVTDALGHATTNTYDAGGRLASTLDRNGQTVGFSYDASSNITGITLPGGSTLAYTYDALGRLTEADNADATLHLVYDDASNLLSQTSGGTVASGQPTVTLSFARDAAGRPTSVAAPWGTTTYAYGGNGLLSKVTDPAAGVFNLGYDPLGQLQTLSRPNGVSDAYAYDAAGQLSSRTSTKAGAAIDVLSYSYDTSGRRTGKTDSAGTTTYGYDTADRLISVLAPAGSSLPDETFAYDPAGNQTQAGQTYDAANRLLSDAKYDYTYDNEGNQTGRTERATGKVTTYAWNALHQMTSAHLPDGTTVTYRYDALGRRVEQSGSAGTTRYANLGANVVAEYDGSNTLRASYVTTVGAGSLPGIPLESSVGGITMYPLTDGVGSVTATTDASGAVTPFSYTAYGSPVGASSGTYAYGTYGYDSATGLYYARSRYYDPSSGRFLSEDPVVTGNLYAYAGLDPVGDADPTGQMALEEDAGIQNSMALQAAKSLAQKTVDEATSNEIDFIVKEGSDKMKAFIARNPDALRRAAGTIIHQMVGRALEAAGFVYKYRGPDLLIMIGGKEFYFEITTEGSISEHLDRAGRDPRYLVAEFIIYMLLL
jgi:RHS repeat-associated protein